MRSARKLARRAARADQGLFLVEGPQAVREALDVPGRVREVFAVPGQHEGLRAAAGVVPWHHADAEAVAALCETIRPQGVVAVCAVVDVPLEQLLGQESGPAAGPRPAGPELLAMGADIRDPGNAGVLIRCADAAGGDGVVLAGDSVDPHNGKAVRASAGSLFHLPVVVDRDAAAVVRRVRATGLVVLAADGRGEVDLDEASDAGLLARPTAWLFGNEAHGLSPDLASQADHRVRIPIHGRAESLNLATAAAVCLYASARARRRPRMPGVG